MEETNEQGRRQGRADEADARLVRDGAQEHMREKEQKKITQTQETKYKETKDCNDWPAAGKTSAEMS